MTNKLEINSGTQLRPKGFGIRHIQVILLFSGLTIFIILRTNMSVGIVAMTDCSINPEFETYRWDEATKALILSSFFWGYIITQLPAVLLQRRMSGKVLLLISMFGASLSTLLIPFLSSFGWGYICAMRTINGLFQGSLFSVLFTMMSKWIHPSERRFSTLILTGNNFGNFFIMIVSGEMATSSLGWPGIFYLSSSFGFCWMMAWYLYGSNSPNDFKKISITEKKYLEETPGTASNEQLPLPWKNILKSLPFYAVMAAQCANSWGYFTLLAEIPTYMREVFDYDIKSSALLSSLPYFTHLILSIVFSILSDYVINNNYVSISAFRKWISAFALWTPMICLIGLGFVTKETATLATILLVCGVASTSGGNIGYIIVYMDMAPNFAGTLFGISNFIADIFSLLGPIYVGLIVTVESDPLLWRIIFFTAAGFYFVGSLIFLIFGRAKLRDWNDAKQ